MRRRVYGIYQGLNSLAGFADILLLSEEDIARYDLVWDDNDPEILFVSETILYDHVMLEQFKKLYSKASVCIFAPGECILPDLNVFDYGIGYGIGSNDTDRIVRRPNRRFLSSFLNKTENPIKDISQAKELLKKKEGYCNFIYSNPDGHKNRKLIFDKMSEYKRVDSYGAYLNNMGLVGSGGNDLTQLVKNSVDLKSRYKFTIAFENATFPGYTSEKAYTSLEAGTIPIYWGNPVVNRDLNSNAIINCNEYDSFDDVIARVREIDENDDLWCQMIMEPWLCEEQLVIEKEETDRYYSFLDGIFTKNSEELRRRPEGTWPGKYQDFWMGRQAGTDKFKVNFDICADMCDVIRKGGHICDLIGSDIGTVAIYGMGRIGMILYDDFKYRNDIMVSFCIDNRSTVSGVDCECIRLSELSERKTPDMVIVTVSSEYEIIRDSILSICDTKVMSIQELLAE